MEDFIFYFSSQMRWVWWGLMADTPEQSGVILGDQTGLRVKSILTELREGGVSRGRGHAVI